MHIIKGLWNNIEDIRVAFKWPSDGSQYEEFFKNRTLFAVCKLQIFQYHYLVMYTFKAKYNGDIEDSPKLYTSHGISDTAQFAWQQDNVKVNELVKSPDRLGSLFLEYQKEIAKLFKIAIAPYIEIIIP